MIEQIKKHNPDNIGTATVQDVIFEPELLKMCEMNRCGCYGKNYTCPPHIETPVELIQKVTQYKNAVVFNKVYHLEDSFDLEGMIKGKNDFKIFTQKVYDDIMQKHKNFLFLGAGACNLCGECAIIRNSPCTFPEKAIASLESYSINVSKLASISNLNYINGQNTVTYFGAVFFNNQED